MMFWRLWVRAPRIWMKLEDTIEAFERTVAGEFDELPEQAFYMVGTIEDAMAKAKQLT